MPVRVVCAQPETNALPFPYSNWLAFYDWLAHCKPSSSPPRFWPPSLLPSPSPLPLFFLPRPASPPGHSMSPYFLHLSSRRFTSVARSPIYIYISTLHPPPHILITSPYHHMSPCIPMSTYLPLHPPTHARPLSGAHAHTHMHTHPPIHSPTHTT